MDKNSEDFARGRTDGYNGYTPEEFGSEFYSDGYAQGEQDFLDDQQIAAENDYTYGQDGYAYEDYNNDFYDYEPSPYDGTYSEM